MENDEKELTPKERAALGGSMLLAMTIVISACCICFSSMSGKNQPCPDAGMTDTNDVHVLLDQALVDISNQLFNAKSPEIRPSDLR